ncbi:uncharacterized protein F5147DRAFT_386033 [Suillus discolor]|uniref:Uncharacterized protein n=1 Tax=Suillus discolor TaxID=1912936 RepID=A0A9P7FGQ9_9AGAM|nr:uncharacterized protein F5147DRAFT_386033 [Suillus discolor]KAG2115958.1 hypothetical protein F5147DRAFT_386033 [Suillus discolor]
MASSSTQPGATLNELILTPIMTLKGHEPFNHCYVSSMCYFPDGKQMISGLGDKTARRWNLRAGKEIEEAREVCEQRVIAVEVSRDGQWIVIAGGDLNCGELKVCEVKTGIVKTFEDPSRGEIDCIDISADNTLLACRSNDDTLRIWSLDTGKLSAGPFRNYNGLGMGTVRFSRDSKKLAFKSIVADWLDVWDIEIQKVDVRVGKKPNKCGVMSHVPMFWTTKDKTIVAVLDLNKNEDWTTDHKTIYELDALTLKTVGAPFEGHTIKINGLALSFDCALLASASCLDIKLWAFESRQLLASFDVRSVNYLILSPDSHQLAYSTLGSNIHICDIPPKIIATIWPNTNEPKNSNILNVCDPYIHLRIH